MRHQPIKGISLFILSILSLNTVIASEVAPNEPMSLWFTQPGESFHESCPIGNGRLGAMDLGGVTQQRVILNESTMWSGGPYQSNRDGAWKCLPEVRSKIFAGNIAAAEAALNKEFRYPDGVKGWWDVNQFGGYQILGDLILKHTYKSASNTIISSPSGHEKGDGKPIAFATDKKDGTKWCVDNAKGRVIWQVQLPEQKVIKTYSLTSAEDVPSRDPQNWELQGSVNGTQWNTLDRKKLTKPFEKRLMRKAFTIETPGKYSYYRITFSTGTAYFQVAEIDLGDLPLNAKTSGSNYRRDLDLMQGITRTQFTVGDTEFTREMVASKPDEVIAMSITSKVPGGLTFTAALSREQHASIHYDGKVHSLSGQLPFNKPGGGGQGVKYLAQLGAKAKGGTISVDEDGIHVRNATQVTLLISAGTNLYDPNYEATVRTRLSNALSKPYEQIRKNASDDHSRYMSRCQLDLPSGPNSNKPTPERVKLAKKDDDPQLAALYFQLGRHLLVSSSRPESPLPANLQGIWAAEYKTPWRGDFHSNINLQMNYWPAEVTGLSECHLPLLKFIKGVAKEGTKTAKAYYNAPGWMANHTQNPWFDTAPSYLPACTGPTCGAWLAQHIWTHYQYTQDKEFLKEYYPILRDASIFCQAVLVEDPNSKCLVTSPSNSPENSYFYKDAQGKRKRTALCAGSTYDMQIIRGLLNSTINAAEILNIDQELMKRFQVTQSRLAPTQISKHGRIMEWQQDYEEREREHRHISHLWGLFPGEEITLDSPDLYAAAKSSLQRRGDRATGWSMAWKACFWARLHDGNHANILLTNLISNSYPNLFDRHPPFQIDGNFGGTAAVAEMLLHSHDNIVSLLPALPTSWATGSVKGLRARNGFVVNMDWKDGALTRVKIESLQGRPLRLKYGEKEITQKTIKGDSYTYTSENF